MLIDRAPVQRQGINDLPGKSKKELQIDTDEGFKLKAGKVDKSYTDYIKNNTTFKNVDKGKKELIQWLASSYENGQLHQNRSVTLAFPIPKASEKDDKLPHGNTYRITRYQDDKKQKLLVENLGIVDGHEPTEEENKKGIQIFKKHGFKFKDNFDAGYDKMLKLNAREKSKIRRAVSILPKKVLEKIKGVSFKKADSLSFRKDVVAKYVVSDHTVYIGKVDVSTTTLFGGGKGGFFNNFHATIVHELGHAVDYDREQFSKEWNEVEKLEAEDKSLQKELKKEKKNNKNSKGKKKKKKKDEGLDDIMAFAASLKNKGNKENKKETIKNGDTQK